MRSLVLLPIGLLAGCVSTPPGPSVLATPGRHKTAETFQADLAVCRDAAASQTAGDDTHANLMQGVKAVGGMVLGVGLGAAIGGSRGATIGAAGGALGGTAYGAATASRDGDSLQDRYDLAYAQCMVARRNTVQAFSGRR